MSGAWMQQMVVDDLAAHGPSTAREIAARTTLPYPLVRDAVVKLSPPPYGIGMVFVAGDEFTLRVAIPEPPPEPKPVEPCRMRLDGEHGAFSLSHTGKSVCGFCREPMLPPPTPVGPI